MLELQHISKTFYKGTVNEKKAIDDLSFRLEDHDFVTVIGSNGAGKSTLLNLVAGTMLPDDGFILLNGKNITSLSEFRRAAMLGRVFQDPMRGTAADMNIAENLALAKRRGKRHGLRWSVGKSEKEEFRALLSTLNLGLENRLEDKVGLLSGGQRQALTLLMATMQKPDLLLLDEHTAALDPKTAKTVMEITESIVSEHGIPTLMITHSMKDAIRYGNRLIMMDGGKIIFEAKGEEKKALTVKDLLDKFEGSDLPDSMIL